MDNLCNVQSEEAVIGSVMIYPDCYFEVSKIIDDTDFYIVRNAWIWKTYAFMAERNIKIDILTLSEQLEKSGHIGEIGGQNYLLTILDHTASALHAEEYARIVKDYSTRRKVVQQASEMVQAAHDTSKPIIDSIPKLSEGLFEAVKSTGGAEHVSFGLAKLFEDIYARIADPKDVWGIPTGFPTLDYVTGGLQKGSVISLSGMPGLGKSLMAVQMAFTMAGKDFPGAIYEMEMNKMMTLRRQLSVTSQVRSRAMKTGRIEEGDLAKIGDAIDRLSKLPIYLSNGTNWTTSTLRADLMTLKKVHGIQWFMLDYLKLVKDKFVGSEPDRLGHLSTLLHDIAQDLDIGCIVVNSMTKEGMRDQVGITGMYGGSEVSHSSDFVLMLEPADRDNKPRLNNEPVRITGFIAKDREGDSGVSAIQFIRSASFPFFAEESNQYRH